MKGMNASFTVALDALTAEQVKMIKDYSNQAKRLGLAVGKATWEEWRKDAPIRKGYLSMSANGVTKEDIDLMSSFLRDIGINLSKANWGILEYGSDKDNEY